MHLRPCSSSISQCRLASKKCTDSELTFIFHLVNAEEKDESGQESVLKQVCALPSR